MSNTAVSTWYPELTPWWSFLLADGAHHKKPHSPIHPTQIQRLSGFIGPVTRLQVLPAQLNFAIDMLLTK